MQTLFDRLENKLDAEKVARLQEAFDRGVDIWAEAGLFTSAREKAGYVKPDFKRDYQPLLTQDDMKMAEAGEGLNKGYNTPVFAPKDVPLHSEQAEKLSYFKLLEKALSKAFKGTAGGKEPNTLLIGPEKRVLTADQVNLEEILWEWERYLKAGVVHNVKKLDPEDHGGVSEQVLLSGLTGNEKRTGGVMRIERDQLIMPSDVGETEMSALDWETKLPDVLPSSADAQDMKQAVGHVIYCLETQGWMPDYYDYNSPETSKVNVAIKSFIPPTESEITQGSKGVVPALCWFVYSRQFFADRDFADSQVSGFGVRAGVRKKGP
ncbi:MAG: hypothetical protein AAB588_00440 [Patescibacteria group bacterium]